MKYLDKSGNRHDHLFGAYFADVRKFISTKKQTIMSSKVTTGMSKPNISVVETTTKNSPEVIPEVVSDNSEITGTPFTGEDWAKGLVMFDKIQSNTISTDKVDEDTMTDTIVNPTEVYDREKAVQSIVQNAIDQHADILNTVKTDGSLLQDITAAALSKIDDGLMENQDELESTIGNIVTTFMKDLGKKLKK